MSRKKRSRAPRAKAKAIPAASPSSGITSGSKPPLSSGSVPDSATRAARAAFANFSVNQRSGAVARKHYVAPGQSVAAVHGAVIAANLSAMENQDTSRSLTLALPAATIKKLLPSYDEKNGTVVLEDVQSVMESNLRGTEFFASGNPTLNRLAVRSQLQQLFAAIKTGGTK